MTAALADLVDTGAAGARLVFDDGARTAGGALAARGRDRYRSGADPGTVVAMLTNDGPSVELVLGAILSGGRLVSLPLPGRGADPLEYAAMVGEVVATYGVDGVIAREDVVALLHAADVPAKAHARPGVVATGPSPGDFELVQFSSGSTGVPKAVALSGAALASNLMAILAVVQPRPGDATVSWLPLSHDMGLIGMLLASVVATGPDHAGPSDVVLLSPEAFLRAPRRWMDAVAHWRGTFTAAPDFGLRMALEHRRPSGAADLAPLRCAIVGGEIVRSETVTRFAATFAADGLDERALCPAYGLAEIGLAATLTPPEERWSTVSVDRAAFLDGSAVPPDRGGSAIELVACGRPLPGYEIGAGGWPGAVAPITVRGPSAGRRGSGGEPYDAASAAVDTGDLGFVVDGRLVVCGRRDDHLVVHGRNIHAPTVEAAVGAALGVRPGRVGIVAAPTGEWTVAFEPGVDADRLGASAVRHAVTRAVVTACGARPDEIVMLDRGELPMTASGKLQRTVLARRLHERDGGPISREGR